MMVREIPALEQPAARLASVGVAAMSTVELLCAVAGPTARPERMYELLNAHNGDLNAIGVLPLGRLEHVAGIPKRGAVVLTAAFELGRRACVQRVERLPLRGPRDVWAHFGPQMEHLPVEQFRVAILDAQHKMVAAPLISTGTLNSSLVHPREVFQEAIAQRAASVVLVHNHPSGDPTPSPDDRAITQQLVAAGRLLDIPVHDHIVIGRGRFTSFAEAGLL
jgi:DNA repair protein RadC